MCPPAQAQPEDKPDEGGMSVSTLKQLAGFLGLATIGLLISTIVLASSRAGGPAPAPAVEEPVPAPEVPVAAPDAPAPAPKDEDMGIDISEALGDAEKPAKEEAPPAATTHEEEWLAKQAVSSFYNFRDNKCAGAKLALENGACADLEVQPQAGANVTVGYKGDMDVGDIVPITAQYYQSKMCPVNVHWHLGAEHYSVGEYDEGGDGPYGNQPRPDWARRARDLAEGKVRDGFRCRHYDAGDEKFTTEYDWKHCEGMHVGETYEVHWPHSSVGDCGTVNQYQSPFYDGVFCNLDLAGFQGLVASAGAQGIASNVGVHGQVFTVVNDERYFYPDMIRGMIVDKDMGKDVAYYTGSTTGTSRDNEQCSSYTPITWQVDRKCHMISASSFDKMCFDMKMQRDDMSSDLHAHGSRELVKHEYVANNQHYPEAEAAPAEAEAAPAEAEAAEATPVEPAARSLRALAESDAAPPADLLPSFLDLTDGSSLLNFMDNKCAGAKLALENSLCADLEVAPQAGANVTKGYVGKHDVGDIVPQTQPYFQSSMCPVNVHWHLGSEHYSVGEYDEGGDGPFGNQAKPDFADRARALAEGKVRDGFRCRHYDASDEKFTKEYDWKHCEGMHVGETYEVHWPHSSVGACGTVDQYQSPFYDGVFCNLSLEAFQGLVATAGKQGIADNVGVHGQVFTIVNDEEYFYGDMIRGMVIDPKKDMGQDVAVYTGSTTGTSRDNEMCSMYSPITWQVDRKCHMISASSFDKMCYDMKMQRDDMSSDLHAHGSRELVHHDYVANNQQTRKMLRA